MSSSCRPLFGLRTLGRRRGKLFAHRPLHVGLLLVPVLGLGWLDTTQPELLLPLQIHQPGCSAHVVHEYQKGRARPRNAAVAWAAQTWLDVPAHCVGCLTETTRHGAASLNSRSLCRRLQPLLSTACSTTQESAPSTAPYPLQTPLTGAEHGSKLHQSQFATRGPPRLTSRSLCRQHQPRLCGPSGQHTVP